MRKLLDDKAEAELARERDRHEIDAATIYGCRDAIWSEGERPLAWQTELPYKVADMKQRIAELEQQLEGVLTCGCGDVVPSLDPQHPEHGTLRCNTCEAYQMARLSHPEAD